MKLFCKKDFLIVLAFLFKFIFPDESIAQSISGVINSYASVIGISSNTLTVSPIIGFSACDKVLIVQMKGATIDQTSSSSFGNITNYNSAGNYEFSTIKSINGSNVSLVAPLTKSYNVSGSVQMISVPEYGTAVITSTLTCQPWNGFIGGVLVFEADTVILNANIDVSQKGFLGGNYVNSSYNCNIQTWYNPLGVEGVKGEGIAAYINGKQTDRGKQANGGGGASNGNDGGGGGGNYGGGGLGGHEYNGCGATATQGIGGASLDYTTDRVFMGGAGGGGFADNGQAVTSGTNGGGIVLINATSIVGNGQSIISNGGDQTANSSDEGSGAGGAGGSIFLRVSDYTTNLNVIANGGKGGSNYNHIWTGNCHGPGGGGAGAILWTSISALPGNVTFTGNGGQPGLVLNPSSSCYNTSYGATAGGFGGVQFNLPALPILSVSNIYYKTIATSSCNLSPVSGGLDTFLWQNNATTSTYTAPSPGTYWVTASNSCYTEVDTFKVFSIVKVSNVSICFGKSTLLSASGGTSYTWSPDVYLSSNSGSIVASSPTTTTIYTVSIVNQTNGCVSDTTIKVTVDTPAINLSSNVTIVKGTSTVIGTTENAGSTYLWTPDNGLSCTICISAIANPTATAIYRLMETDINGCDTSGYVTVTVEPCSQIYVPNVFSPNGDGENDSFHVCGSTECVTNYLLEIYNRWGDRVFHSTDAAEGWNGEYKGKKMDDGVFVYSLIYGDYNSVEHKLKGNITLLR